MNVNFFYQKCYNNIFSEKIFFKYYENKKKYSDLKKFYFKFLIAIKNRKRLKIVTFSDKSFEMYASIASIFLSNNIWIPLSYNLPINRLANIFNTSNPDILIIDKNSQLLKNKLFFNYLKKKKIKIITYSHINNLEISKKKIKKK